MSKKAKREALARDVAHLDDVELEGCWEAALRGDLEAVELRLKRVRDSRPLQTEISTGSPWRQGSSWLFGRKNH